MQSFNTIENIDKNQQHRYFKKKKEVTYVIYSFLFPIIFLLKIQLLPCCFLQPLPNYKLHCNQGARSATWFARDNTAQFLGWCRAHGMMDETLFDSEDLGTLILAKLFFNSK